jgi:hypothetical protein
MEYTFKYLLITLVLVIASNEKQEEKWSLCFLDYLNDDDDAFISVQEIALKNLWGSEQYIVST